MNESPRAFSGRTALRFALVLLFPVGSSAGCATGFTVGFGAESPIGIPGLCEPEPPMVTAIGDDSESAARSGARFGSGSGAESGNGSRTEAGSGSGTESGNGSKTEAENESQRGVVGEPPPDLTLPDLDGNLVPLRSFEGRIAVFDFWAVWCGPCRMSLPFFQDLEDRYREHGLVVVGLHVDDRMPEPAAVRTFVEERGANYLNLLSTVESDEAFRVFAMPTTYIADRDGVVRVRHVGFDPSRSPERIESEVRKLLGLE